ncbi:MAG: SEC-C domain-containing protein [Acidobacteriota bacterium]
MKIGRNDPCWCESGKKYKRCHLERERQEPLSRGQILSAVRASHSRKECLHPLASLESCSGEAIKAHTISRSSLQRIARAGHVCQICGDLPTLGKHEGRFVPKLVGINKASVFSGFCAAHDQSIFRPVEANTFESLEQASFLLGYRSLCLELSKKRAASGLYPVERDLDKGRDTLFQYEHQAHQASRHAGIELALRDLEDEKVRQDEALIHCNYQRAKYLLFELQGVPEIMCSTVHFPAFDFAGNQLQDLMDPKPSDILSFSALANGGSGWLLFSWFGEANAAKELIRSLVELGEAAIPHAIVRFIFENSENTYMSPSWWEAIGASRRNQLVERHQKSVKVEQLPDYLKDDGLRVVDWKLVRTVTNAM